MPEGDFRPEDAKTLLALNRSLHFAPGTAYSYSNGNFRLLATAIEQKAGRPFGDYLMQQVVQPTGMESAVFAAETGALPGDAVGYEGSLATGWRPGINRIHWTGDAGICASIDDMIAWERYIDRTRDDPLGVYAQLSRPVTFRNGSPAGYGLGLVQTSCWGRAMTGHGGAIRGWRLQRFLVPSERLSVAVAFNHESDSRGAAIHLLAAALGESDAPAPSQASLAEAFAGTWLDEKTGLLLDVKTNSDGTLSATYDGGAEILSAGADGVARGHDMTLTRDGGALRIDRPADAIHTVAVPVESRRGADISGLYRSGEFESDLEIVNAGGSCFAGFRGFLGQGPMMPLLPVGEDVWRLACNRALDAPSPGDWTVRLHRSSGNRIEAVSIGCWLARNIRFERRN
jgi:D-aminopeptidase